MDIVGYHFFNHQHLLPLAIHYFYTTCILSVLNKLWYVIQTSFNNSALKRFVHYSQRLFHKIICNISPTFKRLTTSFYIWPSHVFEFIVVVKYISIRQNI